MNKVLWMLFALTVLTACSSSDKYEPAKEPTKVTFSLVSDEGVNLNIWGEASPIEIQVFELKDDSMFMSSDYDQIKTDYKKRCAVTLLKLRLCTDSRAVQIRQRFRSR